MTIEIEIGRLATAFERIATVLELVDGRRGATTYAYSASEVTGSNTGSGTAGETSPSNDEKPTAEPAKKKGRPTKEEAAAKAAAGKNQDSASQSKELEKETPKPELTINDVRAAMTALQSRKDAVTAKGVLEQFGVKALSMLPVEAYAKVIAAAKAA